VNSRDSRRFAAIEQLMERKVDEAPLPEGIEVAAEAPDRGDRRRGDRNRSRNKGKSGKPGNRKGAQQTKNTEGSTTVPVPGSEAKPDGAQKKKKRPFKRRNKNRKPNAAEGAETASPSAPSASAS